MMYDESIIFSKAYIDVNVKQGVRSSRFDKEEIMEVRIDDNMLTLSSLFMLLQLESLKGVLHQVHIFDNNLTKSKTKNNKRYFR